MYIRAYINVNTVYINCNGAFKCFYLELTTPLIVSASSAISHTHTNVCVVAFKYMHVYIHTYILI